MVAVNAIGIVNGQDDPQMMFDSQSGSISRTGVALLGAVAGPADLNRVYRISITELSYGDDVHPIPGPDAYFKFVPEPASILLLGLAALVIRRR